MSINGAHRDDAEPVAVSAPALESPRERSTRPHPGQMSSALPGWEADARWAFPRKPKRVDSGLTNMYEAPPTGRILTPVLPPNPPRDLEEGFPSPFTDEQIKAPRD